MSERNENIPDNNHADLLRELRITRNFNLSIALALIGFLLIGVFWYFFVSDFRNKLNALTQQEVVFLNKIDTLKDRISLYRTTVLVAALKKGEDYGDIQQIPVLYGEIRTFLRELRESAKESQRIDLLPMLDETEQYLEYMHVFGKMMPREFKTNYYEALDSLAAIDANNQNLLQHIEHLQSALYGSFYHLESKINHQMTWLIYGSGLSLIILLSVVFYLLRQTTRSTRINSVMQKRIEREVDKNREKDKLLMEQSRQAAMTDLLSNIAHHWRQPLNGVMLNVNHIVDLYLHDELEEEEMRRFEEHVTQQLQMLSYTIDIFQKMSASEQPKRYFKLHQVLEELKFYFMPILDQDKITLDAEGHAELFGSPAELLQVLVHLVNNAQEAICLQKKEQPDLSGKIIIAAEQIDEIIRIVLSDNGTGVSEKIAHDIFSPYFTTKFKKQGVGISLYLDKQIIEGKFSGKIYLDSEYKNGARFIIELPVKAVSAS